MTKDKVKHRDEREIAGIDEKGSMRGFILGKASNYNLINYAAMSRSTRSAAFPR